MFPRLRVLHQRVRVPSSRRAFSAGGFSSLSPKTLHEIVKLERFAPLSPERCQEIWKEYHALLPSATGTILTKETCAALMASAKKCSTFVHPVWKKLDPATAATATAATGGEDAYMMLLSQFQHPNYFLLTYLEEYKKNPSAAQPWMSVAIYQDLVDSKGTALVRADFMPSLSKTEATHLLDMLVDSYSPETPGSSFQHVEAFNLRPNSFSFDGYLTDVRGKFKQRFLV